jgi:hypothetical protein
MYSYLSNRKELKVRKFFDENPFVFCAFFVVKNPRSIAGLPLQGWKRQPGALAVPFRVQSQGSA